MDFLTGTTPWLQRLQAIGWLEPLAKTFSQLGEETFFLAVLPVVYWCINARVGACLGLLVLGNASLNSILKVAVAWPRPFWVETIGLSRATVVEPTFGLPSGHAQGAAAFWPYLALQFGGNRRKIWLVVALSLALLIGFSRLCLAVHFPHDVLVGWLVGAVVVCIFYLRGPRLQQWFLVRTPVQQVVLSATSSLGIIGLFLLAAAYSQGATPALPGTDELDCLARTKGLEGIVSHAGALFGLLVGLVVSHRQGVFPQPAGWRKGVLRYLLGMIGVLVFWRGLAAVLPAGIEPLALGGRFLRYVLVAGWISWGAPRLFGGFAWLNTSQTPGHPEKNV